MYAGFWDKSILDAIYVNFSTDYNISLLFSPISNIVPTLAYHAIDNGIKHPNSRYCYIRLECSLKMYGLDEQFAFQEEKDCHLNKQCSHVSNTSS